MDENKDAYEALSYTWKTGLERKDDDTTGAQKTIECNGFTVPVGANLDAALRRLRRRRPDSSSRVIWADAICINQQDDAERSHQVASMGDIFRNAHRVVVWLGIDADAEDVPDAVERISSRAFAGVCSVVDTWSEAMQHPGPTGSDSSRKPVLDRHRPVYRINGVNHDLSGEEGPLSMESETWSTVLQLYETRWFHRLWVVQELALAKRAVAVWGGCEMSWEWIGLAAAIIRTNWNRIVPSIPSLDRESSSSRLVPVGVMNAYLMYRISSFQGGPLPALFQPLRFSFRELLALTRQFGCEDKRDNIFGLLGLETTDGDVVKVRIRPDYSKSLEGVYREVAGAMLLAGEVPGPGGKREGDASDCPLAFLSHVYHDSSDGRSGGLPSWVPQWGLVGPQTLTPLDFHHPEFAAGRGRHTRYEYRPDVDPDRLRVRGVVLTGDEVVGSRVFGVDWMGGGVASMDVGFDQLLADSRHTRNSLESLAMTLAAGKSWYGTPIDSSGSADDDELGMAEESSSSNGQKRGGSGREGLLADFVDCLVNRGQLWWTLRSDAFGEPEGTHHHHATSKTNLGSFHPSPNPTSGDDRSLTTEDLESLCTPDGGKGNGTAFQDAVTTACAGRSLFCTASGMRGVGPLDTKPGDVVCVVFGCPVPFVVRKCASKNGFELLGECYVEELMHGEAVAISVDEGASAGASPGGRDMSSNLERKGGLQGAQEEWIELV